jgi:predicted DsbA family dithiol-disulfide isomerase
MLEGQISQSTRSHRLSVKAYKVGGQDMQQALLQAYFKAYFNEGKDIGNFDLLGEIAQSVGLMGKAQVCGRPRFYTSA